jgi:hypothetical protein
MSSWINLSALWKILVFGVLAGVGLPAIFATGMYSLSRGPRAARTAGADSDVLVGGSILGMIGARHLFSRRASRHRLGHLRDLPDRPPGSGAQMPVADTVSRKRRRMALPPVLARIITWLRAGYPEGVPEHDYIPLFALLGSQLTESEVSAIADELATSVDPDSAEAIKAAIATVTQTPPKESDIARVRARLAAGGWPLATPGWSG